MNKIICPISQNAFKNPDSPAIVSGEEVISYVQLNLLVSLVADNFKKKGVRANDRVAIISLNNVEYLIILFALWRIKAVACPLSIYLPEESIQAQLTAINTRVLITGYEPHLRVKSIKTKKIRIADIFQNEKQLNIKNLKHAIDLNQNASIILTSGTSRNPKAVLHTYGNHYFSALGSNAHIPFKKGDAWLLVLPLFHVGGLSILFRAVIGGGAIYIPAEKEPLSDLIHKHKITHLSLVTTQFFRILRDEESTDKLKNLKAILLGGSAIAESFLTKALKKSLPIYTTYGLTEMSSQVATSKPITQENQFHRAHILKYRKLKISKQNEILVKGPTLFKGYILANGGQRPRALSPSLDKDGWFHTGDLGRINFDGTLSVTGRQDNMFISGGENIQPEEIEQYICQLKDVEEAIVIPIADEEFGARPLAFIKTKNNVKLNKHKILAHLKKHLPKFKIPKGILKWPVELEGGVKSSRRKAFHIAQDKKNPERGIFN